MHEPPEAGLQECNVARISRHCALRAAGLRRLRTHQTVFDHSILLTFKFFAVREGFQAEFVSLVVSAACAARMGVMTIRSLRPRRSRYALATLRIRA